MNAMILRVDAPGRSNLYVSEPSPEVGDPELVKDIRNGWVFTAKEAYRVIERHFNGLACRVTAYELVGDPPTVDSFRGRVLYDMIS